MNTPNNDYQTKNIISHFCLFASFVAPSSCEIAEKYPFFLDNKKRTGNKLLILHYK